MKLAEIDRDEIVAMFTDNPGCEYSPEMMMRELGVSKQSVYIVMKPLVEEGRVQMRQTGQRRYWFTPAPLERFAKPPVGPNLTFKPLGGDYMNSHRRAMQTVRDRALA